VANALVQIAFIGAVIGWGWTQPDLPAAVDVFASVSDPVGARW